MVLENGNMRKRITSPRLEAVLSFVIGPCLADIGTDHGYLAISACQEGIIEKALACDISPGPLSKAQENIKRYGLDNQISTRLGFGLDPVKPGEAQCVVIAGMGGMRVIDILQKNPEVVKQIRRLIVQPQHDIPKVRQTLHGMGFAIIDEKMIREDERFYTVIAAEPQENIMPYTDAEYLLGKCLLYKKDKNLRTYVERELYRLKSIPTSAGGRREAILREALKNL